VVLPPQIKLLMGDRVLSLGHSLLPMGDVSGETGSDLVVGDRTSVRPVLYGEPGLGSMGDELHVFTMPQTVCFAGVSRPGASIRGQRTYESVAQ